MALLTTDLLVMKQMTQFMSNDFDILDANGQVVDPPQFLGRDRMEIVDADGLPVAELVKQLALVRTSPR